MREDGHCGAKIRMRVLLRIPTPWTLWLLQQTKKKRRRSFFFSILWELGSVSVSFFFFPCHVGAASFFFIFFTQHLFLIYPIKAHSSLCPSMPFQVQPNLWCCTRKFEWYITEAVNIYRKDKSATCPQVAYALHGRNSETRNKKPHINIVELTFWTILVSLLIQRCSVTSGNISSYL